MRLHTGMFLLVVALAVVVTVVELLWAWQRSRQDGKRRAILVSGAAMGLGREVVQKCLGAGDFVEVRDSRTEYFIPVRYGLGLLPDGIVVSTSSPSPSSPPSGDSGRHSGQETTFGVFHMNLWSW